MQREQGISKAGNRRVRALAVEIAWLWLRYQPDSALSRWYAERFAGTSKRHKWVGIVAGARSLAGAVALPANRRAPHGRPAQAGQGVRRNDFYA